MNKTLGQFRNLIGKDEKAVGFRIVDKFGHDGGRIYEFIGPEDMDERGDIAGAIEDTLHKMLDAGFNEEDIEIYLGAVKSNRIDSDLNSDDVIYIDLDYVIPGHVWNLDFKRDLLRKEFYRRFKFFWLAEHNHTIAELVESVMDYVEESYANPFGHHYDELVECWENERGFDGEIYPCYSEFITSEYLDKEFMESLCWNIEEKYLYLNDPYVKYREEK